MPHITSRLMILVAVVHLLASGSAWAVGPSGATTSTGSAPATPASTRAAQLDQLLQTYAPNLKARDPRMWDQLHRIHGLPSGQYRYPSTAAPGSGSGTSSSP